MGCKVQKAGNYLLPSVMSAGFKPSLFYPGRQKQHVSLQPWYLSTKLHSVTSQEATIFLDIPS
jgi:hypothetical protein